jgi:predicted permease
MLDDLASDLRFALRTMARNPGFTMVVVLTLALGIGANTAIFTLMDQVLLRVLPVKDPERLVVLHAPGPNQGSRHSQSASLAGLSYPMYVDFRDKAPVFDGVLAHWPEAVHLGVKGVTEQAQADVVSGNYFEVLGVGAALGRVFSAEDDVTPGAHPLVVLSHGFWQRRFGGDPAVVSQVVSLNGRPMTVIGVGRRRFPRHRGRPRHGLLRAPAMQETLMPNWGGEVLSKRRSCGSPPGLPEAGPRLEEAKAGANVLYRQILQEELQQISTCLSGSRRSSRRRPSSLPGARGTPSCAPVGDHLLVLMGMVGLVLLEPPARTWPTSCSPGPARQREVAVRLAMGASRRRLVRQFLVESVTSRFWAAALPSSCRPGRPTCSWPRSREARPRGFRPDPDPRVAGFALVLSLLTGWSSASCPRCSPPGPTCIPPSRASPGAW